MEPLKKGELEIMELFWREGQALTHADICEQLKDASRNTIYLHLNHLLKKGMIQTGPSVRRGRTYGRTFTAAVSKGEYLAMQVVDEAQADNQTLQNVFAYFLRSDHITPETLDELEKRIQQRKKELDS